jgi:hypothetical protein
MRCSLYLRVDGSKEGLDRITAASSAFGEPLKRRHNGVPLANAPSFWIETPRVAFVGQLLSEELTQLLASIEAVESLLRQECATLQIVVEAEHCDEPPRFHFNSALVQALAKAGASIDIDVVPLV